jgi:hypothetical protein
MYLLYILQEQNMYIWTVLRTIHYTYFLRRRRQLREIRRELKLVIRHWHTICSVLAIPIVYPLQSVPCLTASKLLDLFESLSFLVMTSVPEIGDFDVCKSGNGGSSYIKPRRKNKSTNDSKTALVGCPNGLCWNSTIFSEKKKRHESLRSSFQIFRLPRVTTYYHSHYSS